MAAGSRYVTNDAGRSGRASGARAWVSHQPWARSSVHGLSPPMSASLCDNTRADGGRSAGLLARHSRISWSSAGGIDNSEFGRRGGRKCPCVMHHDRHRCIAGEHGLSRQHELRDATRSVDVGATIDLRSHRLLGSNVRWRPLHDVTRRRCMSSPAWLQDGDIRRHDAVTWLKLTGRVPPRDDTDRPVRSLISTPTL
jgi:hypothetical protein